VSPYVLLAFALLVSVLLGGVLKRLWERHERRAVEKKWQERERLLDRRWAVASRHEVLRRRSRPTRRTHRGRPGARRAGRGQRSGRR